MRDIQRIGKFCERLAAAWRYVPDMRFGQLIYNVFSEIASQGKDPFFPEEDEMIEIIERFCRENTPFKVD